MSNAFVPALFAVIIAVIFLAIASIKLNNKVDHLKKDVACLKDPHGESSVAGVFKNGRFVVTQKPHRTGC